MSGHRLTSNAPRPTYIWTWTLSTEGTCRLNWRHRTSPAAWPSPGTFTTSVSDEARPGTVVTGAQLQFTKHGTRTFSNSVLLAHRVATCRRTPPRASSVYPRTSLCSTSAAFSSATQVWWPSAQLNSSAGCVPCAVAPHSAPGSRASPTRAGASNPVHDSTAPPRKSR